MSVRNGYRPTDTDYTDTSKFQQLSCREAGKFDYERGQKLIRDAAKAAKEKAK